MKEIGGYFELELNHCNEYHTNAIRLNLGRTAFEYILRAKSVKKVFIPYYTCEVILDPILKLGIDYKYYSIDRNFEPLIDYSSLSKNDYFLYTNYYGLKDNYIVKLKNRITNLIIDNSQAFFSKPHPGLDTFYSPRKFFGLPDGGYLYTNTILDTYLEIDNSENRFGHLIGRIEGNAEDYFSFYKTNDQFFKDQPIKIMSNVTKKLLKNIDYIEIANRRRRNFLYLADKLSSKNKIILDFSIKCVPMVYPFFAGNHFLKQKLIENRVYVATYWKEVKQYVGADSVESEFVDGIIPLPIDQRYEIEDMEYIANIISQNV